MKARVRARARRLADTRSLERAFGSAIRPPPNVSVSEWADRFRMLTSSQSAQPGRWRTSKVEYLRDIMDALSPNRPEQYIVVQKSRRGGFTEGVINNTVGAFMHMAPCPILVLQPSESDAEEWSKDSLDPMLESTATLKHLVTPDIARRKGNTILHKRYRGGALYARSASTSKSFRRILARLVLCDEEDAYPVSVDGEGRPGKLADTRADTFTHTKKIVHGSTPTIKDQSAIEALFLSSTMGHYHVPCPECRHMQRLVWEQIVWVNDDPQTAEYACINCGSLIPHHKKKWMLARRNGGRWVHTYPERPILGFQFSALYSPWVPWSQLVHEWLEARGDPTKEQIFVNTALGETWDLANAEKWDEEGFRALLEPLPEVPARAAVLTAGVDVQHDRLVMVVDAWAAGEERWTLERRDILGDPSTPVVWQELLAALKHRYPIASGGTVPIRAACIDTGDAYTQAAWQFCKAHHAANVWGIKGSSVQGARVWPREKRFRNKGGYSPIMVGVSTAKQVLHARLRRSMDVALAELRGSELQRRDDRDRSAAARWHFADTVLESHFEELTAEVQVVETSLAKTGPKGPLKKKWVLRQSGRRNEGLDCSVYSYAALQGLLATGSVKLERPLKGRRPAQQNESGKRVTGPHSDKDPENVRPVAGARAGVTAPAPQRPPKRRKKAPDYM